MSMDVPGAGGEEVRLLVGAVEACPKRILGPPVVPLLPFFGWEGSPTKIDYRKKGTFILSSLLENLELQSG